MKITELFLNENFNALEKVTDIKNFNVETPVGGPVLMASFKANKEIILVVGVDPDEGKIRVAIDDGERGSKHIKYFADTDAGYKDAVKYAQGLRSTKLNLSK